MFNVRQPISKRHDFTLNAYLIKALCIVIIHNYTLFHCFKFGTCLFGTTQCYSINNSYCIDNGTIILLLSAIQCASFIRVFFYFYFILST